MCHPKKEGFAGSTFKTHNMKTKTKRGMNRTPKKCQRSKSKSSMTRQSRKMNAFSGELQPEFGVLSSGKKTTTSSKSKLGKAPSAAKERLHDTTSLRVKQQAQASTSPKI